MTRPCITALVASALAAAVLIGGGGGASAAAPASKQTVSSRCRLAGATVVADSEIRVFGTGKDALNLFVCRFAWKTWERISLGQRGSSADDRGAVDVRVAGRFVAYRALGAGCGRGNCRPPEVHVLDVRHRKEGLPVPGLSYVLRPDGDYAVVTPPDAAGLSSVVLHDGRGATTVATGHVDAASLALGGATVYWTADGAVAAAAFG